jgi:hypothetical protein
MKFPSDIDNGSHDMFIMIPVDFKVTTSGSLTQNRRTSPDSGNTIILPTPANGLELSEGGNWDETEGYINFAGGVLANVGKAISSQAGAASKHINKGQFINDYASMTYTGSNFRTFSFEWDLIPESLSEAQEISNIISVIRQKTLPSYKQAMIEYPSMWKVFPAQNSEINLFMKDSVITNFTVNFTPDGILRTYTTGHPVAVNMKIDFKELYRASREDV